MKKLLLALFLVILGKPVWGDTVAGTPVWTTGYSVNYNTGKGTLTGSVVMNVSSVNPADPPGTLNNMGWLGPNKSWKVFCIDLAEFSGAQNFELVNLQNAPHPPIGGMGIGKATDLAKMFYTGLASTLSGVSAFDNSQAFQLAVWEVVNETGGTYDVNAGNFFIKAGAAGGSVTAAIRAQANAYLAAITANAQTMGLFAYRSDGKQDFVGYYVPSPAAAIQLAGLGGALGLIGLIRRRRAA